MSCTFQMLSSSLVAKYSAHSKLIAFENCFMYVLFVSLSILKLFEYYIRQKVCLCV